MNTPLIDVYQNKLSLGNRTARVLWILIQNTGFRLSPRPFHSWRNLLLKLFGAQIGPGVHVYPKARIWAPWNLSMGAHSSFADDVDCYNVARVSVGIHVTVSQQAFLCTASHNYNSPSFDLTASAIRIEDYVWIAAGAFVAPGAILREGSVAAARAVVIKEIPPWTVVAGNPARPINRRTLSR